MSGPFFSQTLKLYYKKERDQVDISFMVSPHYVQTFYLERSEFDQIIEKAKPKTEGYLRPGLLVFRKKEYLRWSFDSSGMTHQLRIDSAKWEALVADYKEKMADTSAELVTCIVP